MRQILLMVIIAFVFGCVPNRESISDAVNSSESEFYREHYLSDSNTSEEIKDAINERIVIVGMCPFQAFAAAGSPGPYMVRADREVWDADAHVPPPVIISAQCEHPDNSVIELAFINKTQFNTEEPIAFRVRFEEGKAVLIDQKNFTED